jgi:hypothetical protein
MKGFSERPSFLMEFTNEQNIQKFKQFAKREKINYTAFENDKRFRAVIDRKWEEKIYEFSNNQYS